MNTKQTSYVRKQFSAFSAFIENKYELLTPSNSESKRISNWLTAINKLHILIYDWLNDYTYEGKVKLHKVEEEIKIQSFGTFKTNAILIEIADQTLRLNPTNLLFEGSSLGFLALSGSKGKMIITVKQDDTFQISHREGSLFKEILTQENFLKAIIEVCG